MNLYILTPEDPANEERHNIDFVIVRADSADNAKMIHPFEDTCGEDEDPWEDSSYQGWASSPEKVKSELLGKAAPGSKAGLVESKHCFRSLISYEYI